MVPNRDMTFGYSACSAPGTRHRVRHVVGPLEVGYTGVPEYPNLTFTV